jgi:hypothetical protein
MTQTFRINGKYMSHAQATAYRRSQDSKTVEPIIEVELEESAEEPLNMGEQILADKGYEEENSIEAEFSRLKEIGFANLKGDDRKMYKIYKEQLGK